MGQQIVDSTVYSMVFWADESGVMQKRKGCSGGGKELWGEKLRRFRRVREPHLSVVFCDLELLPFDFFVN